MNMPSWITLILPLLCVLMPEASAHPHPDGQGDDHKHFPLPMNFGQAPNLQNIPIIPELFNYQIPTDAQKARNPWEAMRIAQSLMLSSLREMSQLPEAEGSMGTVPANAFGEGLPLPSSRFCPAWYPLLRWWGPDFMKDVSDEGLQKFCEIVVNGNLTKGEMLKKLDKWAAEQGGQVSKEFKKFVDEKRKASKLLGSNMLEILDNATKLITYVEYIKNDYNLTMKQEQEKMLDLFQKSKWSSLHIALLARMYAHYPAHKKHDDGNSLWSAPIYHPSGYLSRDHAGIGPKGETRPFGNDNGPFNGLFGGSIPPFG